MYSLISFDALNVMVLKPLILIVSPVLGLRPSLAARSFLVKVPNPGMENLLLSLTVFLISSKMVSKIAETAFLVISSGTLLDLAIASIISAFVIG